MIAAAGEFDAFACTYEVHAPRHAAPVSRQSPRLRSRRVRAGRTDVLRAAVRRHRDGADVLGDPGARERQPEFRAGVADGAGAIRFSGGLRGVRREHALLANDVVSTSSFGALSLTSYGNSCSFNPAG